MLPADVARMSLAFDHAVVVVPDLAAAMRAFTDAGFVVTPGGRHDEIPTENALVVFADGGYLELLAVRDEDARASLVMRSARAGWDAYVRRTSAVGRRFLPHLVGPPGVVDFAMVGEKLERRAAELRHRGVAATGPVAMSRRRGDGERLEWQLVLPASARLPFFIEDRTPRALRVPEAPEARAHPNGARGVAEIRLRTSEPVEAALEYADLFGASPGALPDGRTRIQWSSITVDVETGEREGACGARLAGCGPLPPALEALGLQGVPDPPR